MFQAFRNQKLVGSIGACIALLLVVLSIATFVLGVQQSETTSADQDLVDVTNNGANLIYTTFQNYLNNISSAASVVSSFPDFDTEAVIPILRDLASKNDCLRLSLVLLDGTTFTSDGITTDFSSYESFDRVKNGDLFVSDVLISIVDKQQVIVFFAPIRGKNGEPLASLCMSVRPEQISKNIVLTSFDSLGYYHLIDGNGRYVSVSDSQNALLMDENFFDALDRLQYERGFSKEDIHGVFDTGLPAHARYSHEGKSRLAYCQRVEINDWVLMNIVPREAIIKMTQQNISLAMLMAVELCAITLAIFVYIFFLQRRVRRVAEINDGCFRALARQTNKVILEWNFAENCISMTENFIELFGREQATINSPIEALQSGMVHPDDAKAFESVFRTIHSGQDVESTLFRVRSAFGEYHWCSLSGIVVLDHRQRPIKAIGTLEDIQDVVQKEESLRQKSERDQLTGLYNKLTTETRIRDILESEDQFIGQCALMIADIDNFKQINDRMGHQFGDQVLRELSVGLVPLVRKNDIVGRIGGDEFFLFLVNCTSREAAINKAQRLCSLFRNHYERGDEQCNISASVGIAFFPDQGSTFESLYKHADEALYETKKNGKDGFTIYDESFDE